MSIRYSLIAAGLLAAVPATQLQAQDAHVHGIASLNLVIEGDELEIEFQSPAANIVGFEYEATSEADKLAVRNAIESLQDAEAMFGLPAAAGCKVEEVEVELHGHDEHHDEHKEAHGHDDHDDDHKDDHGHDDHKDDHGHDDDHKEAHGHDDHDEHGEEHSEFHAHYHFECSDTAELDVIALPMMERFPGIEEIHLQAITPWGQRGGDIERGNAEIRLK